jgi:hypothetical protein
VIFSSGDNFIYVEIVPLIQPLLFWAGDTQILIDRQLEREDKAK